MKRSDLKELGELLDLGNSGLLVVAATDLEARINAAITRAEKRTTARLQADLNGGEIVLPGDPAMVLTPAPSSYLSTTTGEDIITASEATPCEL